MEAYERVKVLGRGAFGVATLAREKEADGRQGAFCVIKEVDLGRLPTSQRLETHTEIEVLAQMAHPHIVGYLSAFLEGFSLYIVMEFADGGDLAGMVVKKREEEGRFEEEDALSMLAQSTQALAYIHNRRILHRDIKGQNIFLTTTGMVKLGDFGIAKVLGGTMSAAQTMIGTPHYLAPEVCENKPYGAKADVWSIGVVFHELLALEQPFQAFNIAALVLKIISGEPKPLPEGRSQEVHDLLQSLLKKEPDDRPDTQSLLNTPIVRRQVGRMFEPAVMRGRTACGSATRRGKSALAGSAGAATGRLGTSTSSRPVAGGAAAATGSRPPSLSTTTMSRRPSGASLAQGGEELHGAGEVRFWNCEGSAAPYAEVVTFESSEDAVRWSEVGPHHDEGLRDPDDGYAEDGRQPAPNGAADSVDRLLAGQLHARTEVAGLRNGSKETTAKATRLKTAPAVSVEDMMAERRRNQELALQTKLRVEGDQRRTSGGFFGGGWDPVGGSGGGGGSSSSSSGAGLRRGGTAASTAASASMLAQGTGSGSGIAGALPSVTSRRSPLLCAGQFAAKVPSACGSSAPSTARSSALVQAGGLCASRAGTPGGGSAAPSSRPRSPEEVGMLARLSMGHADGSEYPRRRRTPASQVSSPAGSNAGWRSPASPFSASPQAQPQQLEQPSDTQCQQQWQQQPPHEQPRRQQQLSHHHAPPRMMQQPQQDGQWHQGYAGEGTDRPPGRGSASTPPGARYGGGYRLQASRQGSKESSSSSSSRPLRAPSAASPPSAAESPPQHRLAAPAAETPPGGRRRTAAAQRQASQELRPPSPCDGSMLEASSRLVPVPAVSEPRHPVPAEKEDLNAFAARIPWVAKLANANLDMPLWGSGDGDKKGSSKQDVEGLLQQIAKLSERDSSVDVTAKGNGSTGGWREEATLVAPRLSCGQEDLTDTWGGAVAFTSSGGTGVLGGSCTAGPEDILAAALN